MATAIQRRRGNTAQHASFTGLAGEITIDTDKNTVVVHDGSTAGGHPLATEAAINALGGADITAVVAGNGLTGGATSGNANINVGAGAGISVNADNVAVNAAYFDTDAGGTGWAGNLAPSANNTYSLGTSSMWWRDIYVGNNSLRIAGTPLSVTNSGVLQFGGANVAVTGAAAPQAVRDASNADVRALFSATDAGGDGSFSYNSSTGIFTYTGPSQAEANSRIDARLSGTAGITYSSGAISVNQGYFDKTAGGTGFAANFVPSANNTYSLGSLNSVWKDVFVGPGSLYVNGQKVLEDNNGTIVVSADSGQNLSLVTSGGGDLELSAGATGDIQLKSNITVSAGKTITASGGLKLASNLDVNSQYINNLTNPVQAQDAATKQYVDLASYLSAGDGLSKSNATFSVDSSVVRTSGTQTIGGAKTFSNDIVVSGNLTVNGTTTTVNTETISLADNLIDLNSNFTTGSPTENAGVRVMRGDSSAVQLIWNETSDKWQFTNDGATYNDILTETQVKGLFSGSEGITYSGGNISVNEAYFDNTAGGTGWAGNLEPSANNTYSLGSPTRVWKELYVGANSIRVGNTTLSTANNTLQVNNTSVQTQNATSDAYTRGLFSAVDVSGDGSFSYNSSTGAFSYTGPSAAEVRAHFTGGAGLTLTDGTFDVGAGTGITVNANDVAVNATYIKSIFSASDAGGDGSFSYADGVFTYTGPSASEVNARMDAYLVGGGGLTYTSGTFAVGEGTGITVNANDVAVNATYIKGLFSASDAGGDGSFSYSNGVFTYTGPSATEVRAHFTGGNGLTLTDGTFAVGAGTGITVNADNVAVNMSAFSTTNLAEGTNLYYTTARANTAIDARVSGGAGLTYTSGVLAVGGGYGIIVNADGIEISNANVRALFSGSSGVDYNSSTGAITLASSTGGSGLTYTSGVLAVGAGNYITVAADSVAVDATTTATASKVVARDASGDVYANIFSGTATSARYADLAERYEADAILEPGTVVCFGGSKEITACEHDNDHAVAGVVSTDPAYMMNSAAGNNDTHPYIALTGRVPVKVFGQVNKGDLLVASSVKGHAVANNNAKAGTIIGKAISSNAGGQGVIEALINLM